MAREKMPKMIIHLDPSQQQMLKRLSRITGIPMAEFMRSGLDMCMAAFCLRVFGVESKYMFRMQEEDLEVVWNNYSRKKGKFDVAISDNTLEAKLPKTSMISST